MNRVDSFLVKVALTAGAMGLACAPAYADPDPDAAPFSRDENSGKTVMSHDDGYRIILSRFYNAPVKNSKAPELTLFDPVAGKEVELESLLGEKPVVLVFGSYGCDTFYKAGGAVKRCAEKFGDQAEFIFVYVREAHSIESRGGPGDPAEPPVISEPKTIAERVAGAAKFQQEQNLNLRVLVDSLDDRAATRWAGWPVRMFVIDANRTVVYAGKPGPWGFLPTPDAKDPRFDEMRPHEDRFNQESLYEFLEAYFREES
ncbi:MAG: hypothetical protein P1U81_10390 [Verrucomicrobiales bacterium]|nr:hypothetical protein [Verrucomicrobiales bacterium]